MSESIFRVKLGGSPIGAPLEASLARVVVDDTLDVPSYFLLAFRDSSQTILKEAKFQIGDEAEIAVSLGKGGPEKIFHGEITAFELQKPDGGVPMTVVRGYDASHRLHGKPTTMAYLNKDYGAIVREVLQRAGAKPGKIDSPKGKAPEVVSQLGETDWDFLRRIARLTGMVLDVKDNKVDLATPASASKASAPKGSLDQKPPLELTLGADIRELRAVVTAGAQVKEVEVRGWDVEAKKPITATAKVATDSIQIAEKPDKLAAKFKADKFVAAGDAYASQDEVKAAAKALADQVASAYAELDGVVEGNPKLRAGATISLSNVGKPFEGKYTLSAVQHIYTTSGYRTAIRVSGKQDRSLLALTSGRGHGNGTSGGGPVGAAGIGVTVGIVTDINDPAKAARVKVKLPRYDDKYVSGWCRVVYPNGGKGAKGQRGLFAPPKVDDEVLVAFEHGDVNRPVVIGGLYNGKDKGFPDGYIDSSKGRANEITLMSDVGHKVSLVEKAGEEGILIATADDKMKVHLSQKDKKILIQCDHPDGVEVVTKGPTKVTADKDVEFTTKAGVAFDVTKDFVVKAKGKITLDAKQDVKIASGMNFKLEAKMNFDIKSQMNFTANANVSATLKGSATATVEGGMVYIN